MTIVLIAAAALLVALTLLPLSSSRKWYIRAMDFPRVQLAILCVVWLAVMAFGEPSSHFLLSLSAVGVVAALAYQCYWIVPNTQLHDVEIQRHLPERQTSLGNIRILSSNVLTHNRNAQALLDLVHKHKPDILITLESDHWWQEQLDTLDQYPHRVQCPLDNLYGMHVYSQLKLENPRIEFLVEPDKPSMSMDISLNEHQQTKLYVAHPAPPAPDENTESTERDVELIIIAKEVALLTTPVIVAGDLNDVAWSATTRLFREISGLKDPRVGRGMFNTFNACHWFIRWPLDHVFVSKHFKLHQLQRLPHIGSDHFPLLVEFALTETHIDAGSQTQTPTDTDLLEETLDTDVARQAAVPH
ncbi:MAG: endonuclease/exonuclease/phosphatase family protein [Granulosicoccus sp.]